MPLGSVAYLGGSLSGSSSIGKQLHHAVDIRKIVNRCHGVLQNRQRVSLNAKPKSQRATLLPTDKHCCPPTNPSDPPPLNPTHVAGTCQHDMLSGGYRGDGREVRGVEQRSGRLHLVGAV